MTRHTIFAGDAADAILRKVTLTALTLLAVVIALSLAAPAARAAQQIAYDPATAALLKRFDPAAGRLQLHDLPPSYAPADLEKAVQTALADGTLQQLYPLEKARADWAGLTGADAALTVAGGYQFWEFRPDEVILSSDGSDLFALMTPELRPRYNQCEELWLYLIWAGEPGSAFGGIPVALLYASPNGNEWSFRVEGYDPDLAIGIDPAEVWNRLHWLEPYFSAGNAQSPVMIFRREIEGVSGMRAYVGSTYFFYALRTGSEGDLVLAVSEAWQDVVPADRFIGYAQWIIYSLRQRGAEPLPKTLLNNSNCWKYFAPLPEGMVPDAPTNTLRSVLWVFPLYLGLLALTELAGRRLEGRRTN